MHVPAYLHRIELPMPALLGQVNAWLVSGPDGFALVDTGMADATSRKVLDEALAARGLDRAEIRDVFCTHHHADHAGLGGSFRDAGARVLMSASDAEALTGFFARPEEDERRALFHGRHRLPDEFRGRVAQVFPFFRSLQEPFTPDVLVADGDTVRLAGRSFLAVATPGHTPGHLCLLDPDSGALLSGDHVIAEGVTHVSMRLEAQAHEPLASMLAALGRVRDLGCAVGLPGHGAPITDVAGRCREILLHHEERLDALAARLGAVPEGVYELALAVMGPRPKVFSRWMAVSQTLAYLGHLERQGRARQVPDDDGTVRFARA